jgi:hypothetical protein
MHDENATNPPCHFGECLGTSLSPNCPCDYREEALDTTATLALQGEVHLSGGSHPDGTSEEVAGVAENGTRSVQGKDEEGEDFFRWLMESNTPPAGVSAINRDWLLVE